jgi:hypothetical protein
MMTSPPIGKLVCLHYRDSLSGLLYYHRVGRIIQRSHGKPRNHLIDFGDGHKAIVPCGNLFTLERVCEIMDRKNKGTTSFANNS